MDVVEIWPTGCHFDDVQNIKEEPSINFCLLLERPENQIVSSDYSLKKSFVNIEKMCKRLKEFEVVYKCKKCPMFFMTNMLLKVHYRRYHTSRKYSCNHCEKRFLSKVHMDTHKDFYHQTEMGSAIKYCCDKCSKTFHFKDNMRRHVGSHILRTKKVFKESIAGNLKNAIGRVTDVLQKFPCNECQKLFSSHLSLKYHKDFFHQLKDGIIKKYQCNECAMSFNFKENLKRHMVKQHMKSSVFPCDACERIYSHKTALYSHKELMHPTTEEKTKKHLCEFCAVSFSLKENLERHRKKQHAVNFSFPCGDCGNVFSGMESLRSHRDFKHAAEDGPIKTYLCEFCAQSFARKENIQRHMKKEHGQHVNEDRQQKMNMSCTLCNKNFKTKQILRVHEDYYHQSDKGPPKKHQCTICPQSFDMLENLKRHIKSSHNSPRARREKVSHPTPDSSGRYPCDSCKSSFSKQISLYYHKELQHQILNDGQKKRYQCTHCPMSFGLKDNFYAHSRSHGHSQKRKKKVYRSQRWASTELTCFHCASPFSTQHGLLAHVEFFHESSTEARRRHPCSLCSKSFQFKNNLQRHLKQECPSRPGIFQNVKKEEETAARRSSRFMAKLKVEAKTEPESNIE